MNPFPVGLMFRQADEKAGAGVLIGPGGYSASPLSTTFRLTYRRIGVVIAYQYRTGIAWSDLHRERFGLWQPRYIYCREAAGALAS